jgi:ABC-type glycerol-3-phosphate transport system substrate-binding protein
MSESKKLSRRQFLTASGGMTLAAALTAVPVVSGKKEFIRAAAAAQEPGEINLYIRTDIRAAYAGDAAVTAWNEANPDRPVILDEPAPTDDASTKIQAAQAAGDLIWDGFAVIEGPWQITNWVNRQIIVPLDDLIGASTVPNADQVVPAIIPSVLESSKFNGEQYTIPGNVGSVALGWYTKPLADAGIEAPESLTMSWDEVRAAAEKIKETSPELTPYDVADGGLTGLMAMIWGATDTPITDEGLVDWTGEASVAALKWMQDMVKDGLMPGVHTESFGNWLKGGTAIMNCFDVHGTMAQQAFGADAAATGLNIRRVADDPAAGCPFWLNGSIVLNQAKNPQGMIDFYLWWFGPDYKAGGQQIANVAAKPAYQYTYDEFIVGNAPQEWQLAGIDLVRESVPFPANLYFNIQNSISGSWIERAVDPNNNMSAEEALEGMLEEIRTEMEDMM